MKDVRMDVPYISTQLNLKNSPPIVFKKILCKTTKIDFKNSPEMKFCFSEIEIWICLIVIVITVIIMIKKKKL